MGNCNVLIWDWYAAFQDRVDISSFTSNPSQRFRLSIEYSGLTDDKYPGCEVYSLRDITKYGTVIIRTIGRKSRAGPIFSTNEEVTVQTLALEQYMLEVLTGCLEAWRNSYGEWQFYFTPSFISTLEGQFNEKSIVYVEAEHSSELADAFLRKGRPHLFRLQRKT